MPVLTPVTVPVLPPIVIVPLPLLHIPPVTPSLNVFATQVHMTNGPMMAVGLALMVIVLVVKQPVPNV